MHEKTHIKPVNIHPSCSFKVTFSIISHLRVIIQSGSSVQGFLPEPLNCLIYADFVRYNDFNAAFYNLEEILHVSSFIFLIYLAG
jgi:hypothetical protein